MQAKCTRKDFFFFFFFLMMIMMMMMLLRKRGDCKNKDSLLLNSLALIYCHPEDDDDG
jgi:hypothetical protein